MHFLLFLGASSLLDSLTTLSDSVKNLLTVLVELQLGDNDLGWVNTDGY